MSVKIGAERRILRITERLDELGPKRWLAIYGAALYREHKRVRRMKAALKQVNETRAEENLDKPPRIWRSQHA